MKHKGFRIIPAAMFAAMVCVATLCIQFPLPTGGYMNLGDALALMGAFILGPLYGGAAAGTGAALADVITGYIQYAPGTLVIKPIIVLIAALLLRPFRKSRIPETLRYAIAAVPAEAAMVLGYLIYDWLCLGYGPGALASLPGNLVQGTASVAIAALVTPLLTRSKEFQDIMGKFRH